MRICDALAEAAPDIDRRDADTLLAHQLGCGRAWLIAHGSESLSAAQLDAFRTLTARRAAGEPLQYLTGEQEFYGLRLRVTGDTLIPRPETEHLVEAVLAWAERQPLPLRIVDVGTGSGAIALALAAHLPSAEIHATDISLAALSVARENAARLGLEQRIEFAHGDLLSGLGGNSQGFDAIISNPPYIPLGDAATMQREVVAHEPHTALFAGADGLDIYRRLIPAAHTALREGGLLAMELGFGQRGALAGLLTSWNDIHFLDDYAGIPRVALAQRP